MIASKRPGHILVTDRYRQIIQDGLEHLHNEARQEFLCAEEYVAYRAQKLDLLREEAGTPEYLEAHQNLVLAQEEAEAARAVANKIELLFIEKKES